MLKIFITRHGRTLENIAGIFQGHMPGTLSPEGIEQAKKLGIKFANEKLDIIYCSPLTRTRDTLDEILKFKPSVEVIYTQEIIERDTGEATGKKGDEIDFETAKGVERNKEVRKRAGEFLESIITKHDNKTILLVTHGGFIKWFFSYVHNLSEEEMVGKYASHNCSVSLIEVNEGEVNEIYFDNVSHLD